MGIFFFKNFSKIFQFIFFIFIFGGTWFFILEISRQDIPHYMAELGLTFITLWLFFLCVLSVNFPLFSKKKFLFILMRSLIYTIFVVFTTKEYFSFYLWFELGVIPILFIILMGRGSKSRLEAGLFLLIFTITSALILFFRLFYLSIRMETHSSPFRQRFNMGQGGKISIINVIIYLRLLVAFLVKFPIFLLHIWLPKAHVEAPIMGSIILAGVLLKLGGMGILIFKKLLTVERRFFFFLFISLLLWGRCIVGLICFYQNDRKVLIAFSRVNHITLVIFRIIYGRNFSVLGGLLIIIGHGLASSLLFFLISFPYSQSSNRNFFTLGQRGLTRIVPILWVLGLLVNMGFPPFLNFLGEIFIISILLSNPPMFFFFFF